MLASWLASFLMVEGRTWSILPWRGWKEDVTQLHPQICHLRSQVLDLCLPGGGQQRDHVAWGSSDENAPRGSHIGMFGPQFMELPGKD